MASPAHQSILSWEMGHVRAAVLELQAGSAQLLGVATAPVHGITRTSHPDLDRWWAGCDRALSEAEEITVESCGRKIVADYVTMSIPTEITRSLSVVVSRQRRMPDAGITWDELSALLQRGYRKAQDELDTGGSAKDRAEDLVSGSVAEITLDGQGVLDPVGLCGAQLDVCLSFYLAPLEWIRACEIVAERLQLQLVGIIPQHVALASALQDNVALLILLDELHTSVNLVHNGRVVCSSLLDTGERRMSWTTAESLGLRDRQADALMRAYRTKQLREDVEEELARAFWAALRQWMTAMIKSIQDMLPDSPMQLAQVPHRVYLVDLTRRMPEAIMALRTPYWNQGLAFAHSPDVIAFGVNSIGDVLDCTTQGGGPAYLALRGLAHHVAQLHAASGILERSLLEMMRR